VSAAQEPLTYGDLFSERPEVRETVDIVYYDIEGRSARALYEEMEEKGPLDALSVEQTRYQGMADTNINYYSTWRETPEGCRINTLDVTLKATLTMPRWVNRDSGSRRLQRSWDKYYEGLMEHEQFHVEITRVFANTYIDTVMKFPGQMNCESLKANLDTLTREINNVSRRKQRELDRETNHGAKTIPPLR